VPWLLMESVRRYRAARAERLAALAPPATLKAEVG